MKKSLKFLFFLMGLVLAVSFFGCKQLAKYEDLITGEIPGTIPGDGDGEGEPGDGDGGETSVKVVNLTLDLNGGTYRGSGASLTMKLNVGDDIKDHMYKKTYESYPYPDFMDSVVTGSMYNAYHIRKKVGNDVYWLEGFTRAKNGDDFVTTVEASDNNTTVYAKWVLAKDILPVYYDETNPGYPVKVIFRPEDYDLPFDASEIRDVRLAGHFYYGDFWSFEEIPEGYVLKKNSDGTWSQNYEEIIFDFNFTPSAIKFIVTTTNSENPEFWPTFNNPDWEGFKTLLPYEFFYVFNGESSYNPPDFKLAPLKIINYFKGIYEETTTPIDFVNITFDGNGGTLEDGKTVISGSVPPNYPITSTYGFTRSGYLLKGWSRSPDRDEFPTFLQDGWTLYASWLNVDTIETKPVVKDGNGDYVLVFNPVLYGLYGSFIGTTDTGNLEVYAYGNAIPDYTQKVEYSPETKDYRLTIPASHIDSLPVESRDFKFKSTIDGTEKYFASWEYRQSEVYLPSEYILQDGEHGEFLVPDGVSSDITLTLKVNLNGGTWSKSNEYSFTKGDTLREILNFEPSTFEYPEKDGFYFSDWMDSSGVIIDLDTPFFEDITINAKWKQVFSLTLKLDGGVLDGESSDVQVPMLEGDILQGYLNPRIPQKEGMEFSHWVYDSTGEEVDGLIAVTADFVLRAVYSPIDCINLTLDLNDGDYQGSSASLSMILDVGDNIEDYMYKRTYETLPYPDFMDPAVTGTLYNAYHIRKNVGDEIYWLVGFTRTKNGDDFVTTVEASDNNTTVYAKWVLAKDILPVYYDESNKAAPVKIVFRPEDYILPDFSLYGLTGNVEIAYVQLRGQIGDKGYWDAGSPYKLYKDSDGNYSGNFPLDFLSLGTETALKFVMVTTTGEEIWSGYNRENEWNYVLKYNLPYELLHVYSGESYNPPDFKLNIDSIMEFFGFNYLSTPVTVILDGNGGLSAGQATLTEVTTPGYFMYSSMGFEREGYIFKGWSTERDRENYNGIRGDCTLYALWESCDSIAEINPVIKESNGDYTFVFNPSMYGEYLWAVDELSLDIYIRGDFNRWGLDDTSTLWVKDPAYRMTYYPETQDYRLTLPASITTIEHEGSFGAFKFYINFDDSGSDAYWYGAMEYMNSGIDLDPSYYIPMSGNFVIPDTL